MHAVGANLIPRKLTYSALRGDVRNEMLPKEHLKQIFFEMGQIGLEVTYRHFNSLLYIIMLTDFVARDT